VSHLGFVVLGICALNINGAHGAVYQMLARHFDRRLLLIVGIVRPAAHARDCRNAAGSKR
jgi:NADH:ubiquinone oxidoreductase subunit 4 (subunit M)